MEDGESGEERSLSGSQVGDDVETHQAEYDAVMSRAKVLRSKIRSAKRKGIHGKEARETKSERSRGGIQKKYGLFRALGHGEALPQPRILEEEELKFFRDDPDSWRFHVKEEKPELTQEALLLSAAQVPGRKDVVSDTVASWEILQHGSISGPCGKLSSPDSFSTY